MNIEVEICPKNSLVRVDNGDGVLLEHLDCISTIAKILAALAQHRHRLRRGGELRDGHLRIVGEEDDLEAAAKMWIRNSLSCRALIINNTLLYPDPNFSW